MISKLSLKKDDKIVSEFLVMFKRFETLSSTVFKQLWFNKRESKIL